MKEQLTTAQRQNKKYKKYTHHLSPHPNPKIKYLVILSELFFVYIYIIKYYLFYFSYASFFRCFVRFYFYILCEYKKLIIWILKPYASFSILWCKYCMYRKCLKCYFILNISLHHRIPDYTYILFYIFIVAQHEIFYFSVLLHVFRFLFTG